MQARAALYLHFPNRTLQQLPGPAKNSVGLRDRRPGWRPPPEGGDSRGRSARRRSVDVGPGGLDASGTEGRQPSRDDRDPVAPVEPQQRKGGGHMQRDDGGELFVIYQLYRIAIAPSVDSLR